MAAPVATRIRVSLVRSRPRDTWALLPQLIVFRAPVAPADASLGYTRVYITRVRRTRHRQARYLLRRPVILGTPTGPIATPQRTIRVTRQWARPRKTRWKVGPPRVVTSPPPVLQRTIRTRIQFVRTRPRRTRWYLFRPTVVGPFVPPTPPAPAVTRVRTTLGCGEYACYIMERGGQVFIGEVPWTQLTWGRALDDTSAAAISAEIGKCSEVMNLTRAWQHELVIFRTGELVWCGPVFQVVGDPNSPQILARDLSAWWDHRTIHANHDYQENGADLATIFQDIHEDAVLPDNTMGFVLETTATGIMGRQQVFADQRQMAGPFLRDIAQEGIDWTVIGRTAFVGGKVIPGSRIGNIFTDDAFVNPPTVTRDGSSQGNKQYVQGQGSDDTGLPIEGTAEDTDLQQRDGLLEVVESVSTIFDNTAAGASAQSKLDLNKEPEIVGDAVLSPDAPVLISDLIPGLVMTMVLRETVVHANAEVRLSAISVSANSQGGEAVTITCQPLGTTG